MLCTGRVIVNYFRVVELATWRAVQAMREILSFDRIVHSSVGVGKPCCCGQGRRNATTRCSLFFSRPFITNVSVLHVTFTKSLCCLLAPSFATSSSLLDFQPSSHTAC